MLKRVLDVGAALIGLLLLWPLLVIIALLVRFKLGRPVLFRQDRPGLHGEIFAIIKFKTMTSETDSVGVPLPDAARLRPFGQWLRSTSLDELPELWNVLRGNMSFVGPRPLLVDYLSRYSPEQARRHEVRPGITGWAQVNGRNALTWEQKFEMDIWYVNNVSLRLDLRILWRTITDVFKRRGITSHGSATVEEFLPGSDR
jgi:lipopolysaccharide/colanic/teichoic acid biosynthesis glycosyltransferase